MKIKKIAEACECVKDVDNVLKIAYDLWHKDIISTEAYIKVIETMESKRDEIKHPTHRFVYLYNSMNRHKVDMITNINMSDWVVDSRRYIFIELKYHGRRLYEGLASRINWDMNHKGLHVKAGVTSNGNSLWIGFNPNEYIVGIGEEPNWLRIKVVEK